MIAISLWQPWASAMGRGKSNETRTWETDHRGPIAIHAARRWTEEERCLCTREPFFSMCRSVPGSASGGPGNWPVLPLGAVVAVGYLFDVRDTSYYRMYMDELDRNERLFGNYAMGRKVWRMKDFHFLKEPIPFSGSQGLFHIPDELLSRATLIDQTGKECAI